MGLAYVHCGDCQALAWRVTANRVAVTQPSTDVRGMYRRFTEASLEMDHAAGKVERDTGQPVQGRGLWKRAKERALQMIRAGEAPPVRKGELG